MSNLGPHVRHEELIGNNHFTLPLRATAKRRFAADRTVLGKPIPSLDRISVLYSVRVTLTNHYWVTSDERRRSQQRNNSSGA